MNWWSSRFGAVAIKNWTTKFKESTRAVWRWSLLDSVSQDVRYAFRMMGRTPGFTAVAALSLALGIGANTAIFSLINTLILRPLAVREPDRLVELLSRFPGEPRTNGFSWKVYEHFRDENHVFSDLIGVSAARFEMRGDGLDSQVLKGEYVVGRLFPALGVEPAIGRMIAAEDDRLGAPDVAVAVFSWAFWKRRFNLDPAIVGKQIDLNGVSTTVIGVASRDFFGLEVGSRPDVWVPASMEPLIQQPSRRTSGDLGLKLMGRLKPGVSIEQARAEMTVLDRWRGEELAKNRNAPFLRQFQLEVEPAAAGFSTLRDRFARPLLVLMALVGVLLLIACSNVATMLLARGAARQREMAVRVALGAAPVRLVRQALTESLLLSAAGSLLGIFLAYFTVGALVRTLVSGRAPVGLPQGLEIQVQPDVRVLLFTAGVTLLTGLLFGMAPVWSALTSAPRASIRETGETGETRSRRLFGRSLVVAQIALSLVLLGAAGLFIRHLSNLRNIDVGFEQDSVLLVTLDPSRSGYPRLQLSRLYEELLKQLQTLPGVRAATLSGVTPIQGPGAARRISVEGVQESPEARRFVPLNWVGPSYFATFGTPLLAGRDFEFEDEGRSGVAIVNQAMAHHYFGGASPIGKRFTFEGETTPYEIVGVAGNAKYLDLHETPPRTIYLNAFQDSRGLAQQFALRTDIDPTALVAEVRRGVVDVLKTVSIGRVTTLAVQVDASIVTERLIAMLSALFGALGAGLTAIGLYGLLAYVVARRTSEIGVRMALGATERDVTGMVLKGAFGLVCAGLIVGAPLAALSKRFAADMVQAVAAASAERPVTLPVETAVPIAFAALAMMVVALLAAYIPARRASRVQPMEALRHS